MDENKGKGNTNTSDLKACRLCLKTDVTLHYIEDSYLETCLKSLVVFPELLEDRGNYICYACASYLVKNKHIIEKKRTKITCQETLDKDGQVITPVVKSRIISKTGFKSSLGSHSQNKTHYNDDDDNTSEIIDIEGPKNKIREDSGDDRSLSEADEKIVDLSKDRETTVDLSKDGETTVDLSKNDKTVVDLSKDGETTVDLSKDDKTIVDLSKDRETTVHLSKDHKTIVDLSKDEETLVDLIKDEIKPLHFCKQHDSDVETIEVDVPFVELLSDDDGDHFSKLEYKNRAEGSATNSSVPPYHKINAKAFGGAKNRKNKRKNRYNRPHYQDEDKFVRRYFNIKNIQKIGVITSKRYFCKYCNEKYECVNGARDHVISGCQGGTASSSRPTQGRFQTGANAKPDYPWQQWHGNGGGLGFE